MHIEGSKDMSNQGVPCGGRAPKMEKYMETCLLILLKEAPAHGYGLIEGLIPFGYQAEDLQVSTLYRRLRRMENEGLVTSRWEKGEQGPKKRVYRITPLGQAHLEEWVDILRDRRRRIGRLIDRFEGSDSQ